ncbi:hypothetical protein KIPB_004987 [Kipferlia bialata]|uniref:Peptidase M60 domain-containing protein n=1 Tax=Kipferlia bialata TaxID=797122 RepID=A0A9K3GIQ1_9EUKA|nr:hypothetical protein KIPB_004987 [Kipferlia bialata]|eukprot:g4987.t1
MGAGCSAAQDVGSPSLAVQGIPHNIQVATPISPASNPMFPDGAGKMTSSQSSVSQGGRGGSPLASAQPPPAGETDTPTPAGVLAADTLSVEEKAARLKAARKAKAKKPSSQIQAALPPPSGPTPMAKGAVPKAKHKPANTGQGEGMSAEWRFRRLDTTVKERVASPITVRPTKTPTFSLSSPCTVSSTLTAEGGGTDPEKPSFWSNHMYMIEATPSSTVTVHVTQHQQWGDRQGIRLFAYAHTSTTLPSPVYAESHALPPPSALLASTPSSMNPLSLPIPMPKRDEASSVLLIVARKEGGEAEYELSVTDPMVTITHYKLPPMVSKASALSLPIVGEAEGVWEGMSAAGPGSNWRDNPTHLFSLSAPQLVTLTYTRYASPFAPSSLYLFRLHPHSDPFPEGALEDEAGLVLHLGSSSAPETHRLWLQGGDYRIVCIAKEAGLSARFGLCLRAPLPLSSPLVERPRPGMGAVHTYHANGTWEGGLSGGDRVEGDASCGFFRSPTWSWTAKGSTKVNATLSVPDGSPRVTCQLYILSVPEGAEPCVSTAAVSGVSNATSIGLARLSATLHAGTHYLVANTVRLGATGRYQLKVTAETEGEYTDPTPVPSTHTTAFHPIPPMQYTGPVACYKGEWTESETESAGERLTLRNSLPTPVTVRACVLRGKAFNTVRVSVYAVVKSESGVGEVLARGAESSFPGLSSCVVSIPPSCAVVVDAANTGDGKGMARREGDFRCCVQFKTKADKDGVRVSRSGSLEGLPGETLPYPQPVSALVTHPAVGDVLKGVKGEIGVGLDMGVAPLAVYGEDAFAILTGGVGEYVQDQSEVRERWCQRLRQQAREERAPADTASAVVAGVERGALRLMVLGGIGVLSPSEASLGVYRPLLLNMVRWVGGKVEGDHQCMVAGAVPKSLKACLSAKTSFSASVKSSLKKWGVHEGVVLLAMSPKDALDSKVLAALSSRLSASLPTILCAPYMAWSAAETTRRGTPPFPFTFPVNRVLSEYGVAYTAGSVAPTSGPLDTDTLAADPSFDPTSHEAWYKGARASTPMGLRVERSLPALAHAAHCLTQLSTVLDAHTDTRSMESLGATLSQAILAVDPASTYLQRVKETLGAGEVLVSKDTPVPRSNTLGRLSLLVQAAEARGVTHLAQTAVTEGAEDVPTHSEAPTAGVFPGGVGEAEGESNIIVSLPIPAYPCRYNRAEAGTPGKGKGRPTKSRSPVKCWLSTGLYVPAGVCVTVTLPQWVVDAGGTSKHPHKDCVSVRVGCHPDDMYHTQTKDMHRFPLDLCTVTFPGPSRKVTVSSPFGGPLYLALPPTPSPAFLSKCTQTMDVSVSGAIQMPTFTPAQPTSSPSPKAGVWSVSLTHGPPIAELVGSRCIITAPVHKLAEVDVSMLLLTLDSAIGGQEGLMARRMCEGGWNRPERVVFDLDTVVGVAHAGYPIVAQYPVLSALQSPDAMVASAIPHELGHNIQHPVISWLGMVEGGAELMRTYTMDTLGAAVTAAKRGFGGLGAETERQWLASDYAMRAVKLACMALSDSASPTPYRESTFLADTHLGLGLLLMLQRDYGWGYFTRLVRAVAAAEAEPGTPTLHGADAFCVHGSTVAGVSILPVLEGVGVHVSQGAKDAVKGMGLEEWSPSMYQDDAWTK